jgi:hypothetical protein
VSTVSASVGFTDATGSHSWLSLLKKPSMLKRIGMVVIAVTAQQASGILAITSTSAKHASPFLICPRRFRSHPVRQSWVWDDRSAVSELEMVAPHQADGYQFVLRWLDLVGAHRQLHLEYAGLSRNLLLTHLQCSMLTGSDASR